MIALFGFIILLVFNLILLSVVIVAVVVVVMLVVMVLAVVLMLVSVGLALHARHPSRTRALLGRHLGQRKTPRRASR